MRKFLLALPLIAIVSTAGSAFDRQDIAEKVERGCTMQTLSDPDRLRPLAQLGLTAREFCSCLGEHVASSVNDDQVRRLAENAGHLPPGFTFPLATSAVEECASMREGR